MDSHGHPRIQAVALSISAGNCYQSSVSQGTLLQGLVVSSPAFEAKTVADVVLVFLLEFIIAHIGKRCPPKTESLSDVKTDALMLSDWCTRRQNKP